jgi:hypothetical protein
METNIQTDNFIILTISGGVGKNILANIKNNYKDKGTSINFKYGGNDYEVKTTNIQNLVKRFTKGLFRSLNINI